MALGQLSAPERACVELRLGRRLPIDEVASMLDVAVPEARHLLLRALRAVASELRAAAGAAR
jgi:DNA-directed RNA polymerase specialized sigma24 family protein